ncbi:hypothetical protein BD410DRAFT_771928 [Rickenella mellea]|uniref:Pre-mRNA polyadenylation factor Fip1 domain-containing protein n=1 Tax=Rickenella mellea TaxID=50990 RepID=A0A4Y7Q0F8_9AGAM|nr:hypothetical protein BD410DRAFT_771928 [Rickenella mellea]
MDEDEDSFLYGDAIQPPPPIPQKAPVIEVKPIHVEEQSNGIIAHLEAEAEAERREEGDDAEAEMDAEGEEDGEEESDDDVEFIMEPVAKSMDFRNRPPGQRPTQNRVLSGGPAAPAPAPVTNLTTEYTPRERGTLDAPKRQTSQAASSVPDDSKSVSGTSAIARQHSQEESQHEDDGPDPSTLPPATAPPSHPAINPAVPGILEGRSIFDVDVSNLAEKPWRRPGSDLSDWFNYGFDEISWEAYCYRRRDMGEMATVLKANVINFAGMPEEQLVALPPEVRTMVMTGATAMMSAGAAQNPGMMNPAVGMNPMMDMSGMGGMGMGPMGMGMNGDMGMAMQGGTMMQEGPVQGPNAGGSGASITPEQGAPGQMGQMGMQEGFAPNTPGMMGMNAGGEFGMQETGGMVPQQMYPGMEGSGTPVAPVRGATPGQFRGRGMVAGVGLRGRGANFPGRGRGRGAMYDGMPPLPVRPASPLPPGVPTGPRNPGNRYKDRDNNGPAVDGLDYGGGKDSGGGTPSEADEKSSSRKRRASPDRDRDEDRSSRSSKRR